jgi:hypothetical protein
MASFTDQKQRDVTQHDLDARWGGSGPGERFKCYLCAHKFVLGDKWRWVYGESNGNLIVCGACDGTNEEVVAKWKALCDEYFGNKFWALKDY